MGYATGRFGKNDLSDLNKYVPTVHGFDESGAGAFGTVLRCLSGFEE